MFEFNLITNTNPQRKNIMTVAQNAWKKIGVKCNTQYFEWAVFLKDFVNKGEFDALVLGWSMTPLDPDLYQLFHSSQTGPSSSISSPIKAPRRTTSSSRSAKSTIASASASCPIRSTGASPWTKPYTFLYAPKSTRVLDKKIVIVEREPDGRERFVKIYPTKGGNILYYFNRWRKLDHTPDF